MGLQMAEPEEIDVIRSAVAAILGYSDLLMSESAGILTPLQKRFLSRIKVSATKINTATTNENRINESAFYKTNFEQIIFDQVLKKVLFEFGTFITQKGIKIELANPGKLPIIQSNYSDIEKILRKVINSVLQETPVNGKVIILLKSEHQSKGQRSILCSITSYLHGSNLKPAIYPGEMDKALENELSPSLSSINGQVWINQAIHELKTVHLLFMNNADE
jgi:hypothetical protein